MGIFVDENGPTTLLKILSDDKLLWDNRTKTKPKGRPKVKATPLSKNAKVISLLEYVSCKKTAKTRSHKSSFENRNRKPSSAPSESNHSVEANSGRD